MEKNKLLIIDDEDIVRDSIIEILTHKQKNNFSMEIDEVSSDLFGDDVDFDEKLVSPKNTTLYPDFEISEAKNGKEGIEKVRKAVLTGEPFKVIFLDMRMPGWDGLTTFTEIRKLDPKAQISFITAFTDYSIDEIAAKAGGDVGYLNKPFNPEEIIQLANKSIYDWSRLNNLEKLLDIIGKIELGTNQLITLLTNIQHQLATYIHMDYSILGRCDGKKFHEISSMGVGKNRIQMDLLMKKIDMKNLKSIQFIHGVLICPLEQYCIIGLPYDIKSFNQERLYLLELFVENAVRAIKNVELRDKLMKKEKLSAVGKAINMVLHDIRNPLHSLSSIAYLLENDPGNKEQNIKLSRMILNSTDEAIEIIQDILDFTKNKTVTKIELNLKTWIENLVSQIRNREQFAAVNFITDVQPDVKALFDEKKMIRVIKNVIINSCEALIDSSTKNPTIIVATEQNSDYNIIKITDNGPGIPLEIKDTLFKAFVTQNKGKGTGLGLAIAKQIVEAHNGYIKINQINVGAEFEIGLKK